MRRILHTAIVVLFVLSCSREREAEPFPAGENLPAGVPVMLTIPFGADDMLDVEVSTKADAGFINEANIHDIYVFLFDKDDTSSGSPRKVYGRYFNFDHKRSSLAELNEHHNECWYVENKSIDNQNAPTRGAVKISTVTRDHVALVVLANVDNSVMEMDNENEITRLNEVEDLDELRGLTVKLEQDIVNRKNLFLMLGTLGYDGPGISTGSMHWNKPAPKDLEYDPEYKVQLKNINAKVKFRIKVNPENISAVTPVYWQVCRAPNSCHLFSDYNGGETPEDIYYFDSQQAYFEGTETEGEPGNQTTYYTFCFYILENELSPVKQATKYYQRELQSKTVSSDDGYEGPSSNTYGTHYVENGDWEYANPNSTYVKFDIILTLTPAGITAIGADDPSSGMEIGHALTSDAIFTVHLGDFNSSNQPDGSACFNNYNTKRGYSYTYNVTVNNSKSIYTEVISDKENQAGQEGFLLLTDAEMINADAHYEYHQLTFKYRPDMQQEKFSWYVKTPFGEGGPKIVFDQLQNKFTYSAEGLDYLWVKFGVNEFVNGTASSATWDKDPDPLPWVSETLGNVYPYSARRHKYPGDSHYDPAWEPGQQVSAGVPVNFGPSDENDPMYRMIPDLMDITQLIRYIFWETSRETAHRQNPSAPPSAFIADDSNPETDPVIRFTAFIDEYYYEEHPIEHTVEPDLWRKFVNAQPREMHILSDARQSRDRKSDVILSSHSIIQQSIQTIYNIYAADLHTLWGTEHEDEMRKLTDGWPYWPNDPLDGINGNENTKDARSGDYNTELGKWNGRLNSAYIWDFYSTKTATGQDRTNRTWDTFLDYSVHNEIPELKAPSGGDNGYQGMAYSCLTRNRDNNGDGIVDRSEIRWYLAACNQLAGMWVGNEALSINARLYKPSTGQWRAHIMSSSGKRVSWSEEGGGATEYNWDFTANRYTWPNIGEAAKGESVRCLRNIGTFTENGEIKDISYAPYNYEIEHYFTKEGPEPEGPFTFYFDRLNPKSIRQLSESELPYADQFNMFNCVYLKLETQSRADDVVDFNIINTVNAVSETNPDNYPTNETINPEVTKLGHNPYCPPGYRFPNHSEMLLMSLYLPTEYFECDSSGKEYGDGACLPTRTYFDRGYYGDNRSGMTAAEISRERSKVGWGYTSVAHKQSCLQRTQKINHSRCVRDVDMTGWIEGDIELPSETICLGDPTKLGFSFCSSAASFVSASLQLCYTDGEGFYHEQDIPVQTTPSGMQYVADQMITLPTLAQIGMADDMDEVECKFKITLRNTATSRTIERPFRLVSHLTHCSVSLPSVSDPDKGMPVSVKIGSRNNNAHLTKVTLHWKASDGSWQTSDIEDGTGNVSSLSRDVYLKDIIGDAAWGTEPPTQANRYKEYLFYVTASCSDGSKYVSETVSNQVLKLDFCLNPVPEGGWTHISQCNGTWTEEVTNLNFANGDFIEVDMDLRNCRYKYLTGAAATDLGQDNIIGFSADNFNTPGEAANTKTIKNSIIWYYPSVENLVNSDNPADWGWIRSRVHAGKWSANTPDEGVLSAMNLILDKDGLIRDGSRWTRNPGDWNSRIKPLLTNSSSLWLGSVEGVHHSRATYNFIRVVRVKDPAVTPVPRD